MPQLQPINLTAQPNQWDELTKQANYLYKDIYSILDELKGIGTGPPTIYSGPIFDGDITVNGGIIVTGSVDGRDVSADGLVLDAHVADTSDPHATVEDAVYGAGWNADTAHAPSQNAVYDILSTTITDLNGFPDSLKNLTAHEIGEYCNLEEATTISAAQWGYLGNLDQDLITTSSVKFDNFYAGGHPWVDVVHYGADPTGTDDSTTEIANAVTAAGQDGVVFFPPGHYKMTGTTAISVALQQKIMGSGAWQTEITCTTNAQNLFDLTSVDARISGFSIINSAGGGATSGTTILVSNQGHVSDIRIRSCYDGIKFTSGGCFVHDIKIDNYANIALYFDGANDIYINHFLLAAADTTAGTGVRLVNSNEAIILSDGDILFGTHSMSTDGTWGVGTRAAYCKFNSVYFDSSASGVVLDKMALSEFTNCWFSGGRTGGGSPGCTLDESDSVSFVNSTFFQNGSHGCHVTVDATRFSFNTCKFIANSVTAGSGNAHGLYIAANTTDFEVIGCTAHKNNFTGGNAFQGYGIYVAAGTSDRYVITGNDCHDNVTGEIFDGGTGTEKIVQGGNIGDLSLGIIDAGVITCNGLKIKEAAAALADTAGYGQFWIENTAPCTPRFTSDTGYDFILSGLEIKGTTGGPTAQYSGHICINTFDNTIDMYADGAWRTLASW